MDERLILKSVVSVVIVDLATAGRCCCIGLAILLQVFLFISGDELDDEVRWLELDAWPF